MDARLRSTSPTDPQAYEICIGDAVYPPSTNKRTTCEFAIDTPLISFHAGEDQTESDNISRVRPPERTGDRVEGLVKLLTVFSIHSQNHLYQNFLVLGKSRTSSTSYERIGIGTGKIYSNSGLESRNPIEPQLVKPFEWLAVEFEKRGRSIEGVAEEAVCII